jgi:cysteine synthase A
VCARARRASLLSTFAATTKEYLSTDLLRAEPIKDGYVAPEVELLSYQAYKRVCHTCFELE